MCSIKNQICNKNNKKLLNKLCFVADKSVETLKQSGEAALNKYTTKDKELSLKLQENRSEQEELRKRLATLMEQENALVGERDERKATQERAKKVGMAFRYHRSS
jgi:regulator of PEP synthase PpsR (kinase-PPPase family)